MPATSLVRETTFRSCFRIATSSEATFLRGFWLSQELQDLSKNFVNDFPVVVFSTKRRRREGFWPFRSFTPGGGVRPGGGSSLRKQRGKDREDLKEEKARLVTVENDWRLLSR